MSSNWMSSGAFRRGLYAEHFEEAAFLHLQCKVLRLDDDLPFTRVADFERRFAAHVDGLVVGGDEAQACALGMFDPHDAGHGYVLALLAAWRVDATAFARLWRAADLAGASLACALGDALLQRLPDEWRPGLLASLPALREPLRSVLLDVAVAHGLRCEDALRVGLVDTPCPAPRLLRAAGRARVARKRLAELASVGDVPSRREALLTLLRSGEMGAPPLASSFASEAAVSHLALGLAGGEGAARALLRFVASGNALPETLLALGLLGHLSAVRPLIDCLDDDALATPAAEALEWITGAGLCDDLFVPEPVDPAAWFDHERERHAATGAVPLRPDGRPYGSRCLRPSTDAARWHEWTRSHAGSFAAGLRHRFGLPSSATGLVSSLSDPRRSSSYRRHAVDELAIRYGAPTCLDVGMAVGQQLRELARLQAWAAESAVPAGAWSYAGALC